MNNKEVIPVSQGTPYAHGSYMRIGDRIYIHNSKKVNGFALPVGILIIPETQRIEFENKFDIVFSYQVEGWNNIITLKELEK
jgi:hypothetical protein